MSAHDPALYGSWIELSESALKHNVRFLKRVVGRKVVLSSVIKGNAYGHGIETFVPMAEHCGIRHFSTFGANEAYRAAGCRTKPSTIMIMGSIPDEAIPWAVENEIQFWVFDLGRLDRAIRAARTTGKKARVHLELETGLNRTGIGQRSLRSVIRRFETSGDTLSLEGVCTHFAGAESVGNYLRIQNQIAEFERLSKILESAGIKAKKRHTACSAAALNYPQTRMDLVRSGISLYGFWPTEETRMRFLLSNHRGNGRMDPLHRVMSWKSRVMSLKTVRAGEFVGYGITHQAPRREKLAAVPVGYYDGFSRSLSNLGFVLINGERAEVRGLVNMNMVLVDVTHIDGVRRGSEVVIVGRQDEAAISIASFSDMMNHLNYEVLVRIPDEIPRIVVD